MKKTLAIILSVVMLFSVLPFSAFAADYDRAKIAANDAATIEALSEEQIASVILDWADRQILDVASDFDDFEVDVMGQTIALEIPEITGIDSIIGYKSYLAELGGDFANLNTESLATREASASDLDFIYGVLKFMADNSEIFGKVFHWEEDKVFDYGKVGEYILALDPAVEENKQIIDFYNNYLIGNDIQEKFIAEIAKEMNYTVEKDENGERVGTFDEIISNGILSWFAGLCEKAGILSADGIAALKAYDLRTTDLYTLVENFVGLVQSDNQVEIDTYYNYLLDTVVRTMLKAMLGQTAEVGADAALPASFEATYTDLALLESISGGTVNYKAADGYYQITVAGGEVTACKALTWVNTLDVDFEPPVVGVYTGATDTADAVIADYNCDLVQNYRPGQDYTMTIYSTYADQINAQLGEMPEGMTAKIVNEAIPAEITAVMTEENAKAMKDLFAVKVDMGETNLLSQVVTFQQIADLAEKKALEAAQEMGAAMIGQQVSGVTVKELQINDISIDLAYNGYATEDEFICQVTSSATADVKLVGSMEIMGSTMDIPVDLPGFDVSSYIQNPVATIVLDNLSGSLDIDIAAQLPDFLDTDFVIDADLLDIAGNYDAYNGAVGQVNRILVDLTAMLLSDAGEAELDLKEGGNEYLTDNLQKVCDKVNEMMAMAEEVMNDAGLQEMLKNIGVDAEGLLAGIDLGILYDIDFSSVEALYVSAISLGLDVIDDKSNATITEIHAALEGLTTLDDMAVAMTNYALDKFLPTVNEKFAADGLVLENVEATGTAKDVIMTKLVAIAYDAATWGVDTLLNGVINDFVDKISADLPDVSFTFGVAEGATWQATLAAMVDRVYELADGIVIACDNDYTDTFDKISAVANALLPLGSLASNCASENFALDANLVLNDYIFADALAGDLEGFLGLFETAVKTDDVAADVPVTKALINASEHIVDAIFPDTVNAEDYEATVTVKEDFTSGDNDVVIASNNMDSIYARREALVPAALRLVREAGILSYFAKCDKDHTAADLATVLIPGKAATCTEKGVEDAYACADCGYVVSGGADIPAKGHKSGDWVQTVAPTCTAAGTKIRSCTVCGAKTETCTVPATGHTWGNWYVAVEPGCESIGLERHDCKNCDAYEESTLAAKNHADADGNEVCDNCGADLGEDKEMSFFDKIKAFFQRIIDWFKNLFK